MATSSPPDVHDEESSLVNVPCRTSGFGFGDCFGCRSLDEDLLDVDEAVLVTELIDLALRGDDDENFGEGGELVEDLLCVCRIVEALVPRI